MRLRAGSREGIGITCLRILHVVPSYLPAVRYGGPIFAVHGLCKALAARGHEVEVFTTNVDGLSDSAVPIGVPVLLDGVKVWYFAVPALRRLYWSPAMTKALWQRVADFDVVHIHSVFLWPTFVAARIARHRRIPYLLAPRGMLVEDLIRRKNQWVKRTWITLVERKNLANATLVHFTSRVEAQDAATLGMSITKFCTVPNGVDTVERDDHGGGSSNVIAATSDQPFLLFIGRINWKKGLDRLIAALPYAPDCDLVVAGNDEEHYTPVLKALAASIGVAGRVSFVGPVYGDDKIALLRGALMLVLPSYSENFGNVVLEALAVGCPVTVTPEVGAADIVRESGAGAVFAGDPAKLGAGISALVSNPAMLRCMGEKGRRFIHQHYTWHAVCVQMETAYRQAIAA